MNTDASGYEESVSSTTEKNEDCGECAVSGDKDRSKPGRLLIKPDGIPFLTGDGVPTSQKCILMPDEKGQMKMYIVPTKTRPCEENKVFIVAPLGENSWTVKSTVGNEVVLTSKSNQDNSNIAKTVMSADAKTITSTSRTSPKVMHVHAGSSGSTKVSFLSRSAVHQDSALRFLLKEKKLDSSTVKITDTNNPKLATSKLSTANIKHKVVTPFEATKMVMPDGRIFTTLLPSSGSASSLKSGNILTGQNSYNGNMLVRQAPSSIPVATTVTTTSGLIMGTSILSGIPVAPKMSSVVYEQAKYFNGSHELISSQISSSESDSVGNSSVITEKNVQTSSSPNTSVINSELSIPDISPQKKPYPMLLFSREAATRIGMKKTTHLLDKCDMNNSLGFDQGHAIMGGNASSAAVTSQNKNLSQIGLTSIFSSVTQGSKITDVNISSVKPPHIPNCNTTRPEVKMNTFPVLFVSNGTYAPTILVPSNVVVPTPDTQSQTISPVINGLIPSNVSVSQTSNGASQMPSMTMPPSAISGLISVQSSVLPQVSKVTQLIPAVTSATAKSVLPPFCTVSQVSKVANTIPFVTVSTKCSTYNPVASCVSQVSKIVQNASILIPPSILSQNSQNISMSAYAYAKISAPQLTTSAMPVKVQTVSVPLSTHSEKNLKSVAVTIPIYTHSVATSRVTTGTPLNTITSISSGSNQTSSFENKKSESVRDKIRINSLFAHSNILEKTTATTKENMKSRKCDQNNEKKDNSSQTKVLSSLCGSNLHSVSRKDVRNVLRLAIFRKHTELMEELNSSKTAKSPEERLKISGKKFTSISNRDVVTLNHNSKTSVESLKGLCKPCYVVLRKLHFSHTTMSSKYAAIYKTDSCRKSCREEALKKILKKKRKVEIFRKTVTGVEKVRNIVSDVKSEAYKRSLNSVPSEEDQEARSGIYSRSLPVTNDEVTIPNNRPDTKNLSRNSRSLLFSASTLVSDMIEQERKTDMCNAVSIDKASTAWLAPKFSVQSPSVVTVGSSLPDRLSSTVSSSGSLSGLPVIITLPTTTVSARPVSLSQSRFSSPSSCAQFSVADSTSTFWPVRPTLLKNQVPSGAKVFTLNSQPTFPSQTIGARNVLTSQTVIAKPPTTVLDMRPTISKVCPPHTSSNPVTIMVSPSPVKSIMPRIPQSGVIPSTVETKSTSGIGQRYHLIKVDDKNILIPANTSQQQRRTFIIPKKDCTVMPTNLHAKSISTPKGNITLVSVLPTGNKANQNVGSHGVDTTVSEPTGVKIIKLPDTSALTSSCPTVRVKSEPRTEGYGDEENTVAKSETLIKMEPITTGYGDEGNSGFSSAVQNQHQTEQVRKRSVSDMDDSSGTKRKGCGDQDDRANRVKSMRLQSDEDTFYNKIRMSEEEKLDDSSVIDTGSEISEYDGRKSLLTVSGLSSHEDKIRRLKQLMQEKIKALEEFKRQRDKDLYKN